MDRGDLDVTSLVDIEASLERLMPRGLGEETRVDLEAVVDDLASGAVVVRGSFPVWQSVAAAFCLGAIGVGFLAVQQGPASSPQLAQLDSVEPRDGLEVLERLTWIDGGAELGVRADSLEGELSRGWSYSGVEEERLLHAGSGYEVILQRGFEAELHATSYDQ